MPLRPEDVLRQPYKKIGKDLGKKLIQRVKYTCQQANCMPNNGI